MRIIKCVVVGDGAVGKTSLLYSYATNKFASNTPAVVDNYAVTVMVRGEPFSFNMFDAPDQNAYPQTDVFVVCFSVVSPSSFVNAREIWLPAITHHCPDTPILLVGTQTDLRGDDATAAKLAKKKEKPITFEEADKLSRELKVLKYMECSTFNQKSVNAVLDEAILVALGPPPQPPSFTLPTPHVGSHVINALFDPNFNVPRLKGKYITSVGALPSSNLMASDADVERTVHRSVRLKVQNLLGIGKERVWPLEWSLRAVKESIAVSHGLNLNRQTLLRFCTTELGAPYFSHLDDNRTLGSYDFKDGERLLLIPTMKSGPTTEPGMGRVFVDVGDGRLNSTIDRLLKEVGEVRDKNVTCTLAQLDLSRPGELSILKFSAAAENLENEISENDDDPKLVSKITTGAERKVNATTKEKMKAILLKIEQNKKPN